MGLFTDFFSIADEDDRGEEFLKLYQVGGLDDCLRQQRLAFGILGINGHYNL